MIGIITYDGPHLKTEQVLLGLRGKELAIFGLPFLPRKPWVPLFDHRPHQGAAAHPAAIAKAYGWSWNPIERDTDLVRPYMPRCDYYLVLVGKLISAEALQSIQVLNTHAGLIPCNRGLDTLKWAILDDVPLGITTHVIDHEIDMGMILRQVRTPVFWDDTLSSLARRHYELEITENIYAATWPSGHIYDDLPVLDARRRTPKRLELEMFEKFPAWKEKYAL